MSQYQTHYPCKDCLALCRGSLADQKHDCWVYHVPLPIIQEQRLHRGGYVLRSTIGCAGLQIVAELASCSEKAIARLCSFSLVNSLFLVNSQRTDQSVHRHVVVAQGSDC
jgi:hypothetical protein